MNDGEASCSQVLFSELLNPTQVCSNSSSGANSAANLMQAMFIKETRISSNVAGKCDKRKLDPSKIASIKVATFNMWPCTPGETLTCVGKPVLRRLMRLTIVLSVLSVGSDQRTFIV